MKTTILTILITVITYYNVIAQNVNNRLLDGSLQIGMGTRKGGDNAVKIESGVSGRRLPFSLLVGFHTMEIKEEYQSKIGINKCYLWGTNATFSARLFPIDSYWLNRSIDFNLYGCGNWNKQTVPFWEYGFKTGIMINDRSRIYVNAGKMQNKYYNSFTAGVTFSLLFFNGYSAY